MTTLRQVQDIIHFFVTTQHQLHPLAQLTWTTVSANTKRRRRAPTLTTFSSSVFPCNTCRVWLQMTKYIWTRSNISPPSSVTLDPSFTTFQILAFNLHLIRHVNWYSSISPQHRDSYCYRPFTFLPNWIWLPGAPFLTRAPYHPPGCISLPSNASQNSLSRCFPYPTNMTP